MFAQKTRFDRYITWLAASERTKKNDPTNDYELQKPYICLAPGGGGQAAKEDMISYREQQLNWSLERKENAAKQLLLANEIRSRPVASSPNYDLARVAETIAILFEVI